MIQKSIISVHFFGDLNDRYWTGHVLAQIPDNRHDWFADDTSFYLTNPSGEGNKNKIHSQRKILEARWFAKAIKNVVGESRRILNYVSDRTRKDVCLKSRSLIIGYLHLAG